MLIQTVKDMLRVGLLAADESHGSPENPKTIEKRLEKAGIPLAEEWVDKWRLLVRDCPHLGEYVSGIILEKSRLKPDAAIFAGHRIVPGVKTDGGTNAKIGPHEELLTVGLDDLPQRLAKYKAEGARFTKWRTVTPIGSNVPTQEAIDANMDTIVKQALVTQAAGLVPICEPEVLIDGDHTIEKSFDVTKKVLSTFFAKAKKAGVFFPGMILKTSMVIYGKQYAGKRSYRDVAQMTVKCLKETVPAEIGGVVFLSGGQEDLEATMHLNEMHKMGNLSWPLTFSYSRAIQDAPMKIWVGKDENVAKAQEALIERAKGNALAAKGKVPDGFTYKILT